MKIVDFSIRRKITLIMASLIVIGFSFFALSQLKVALYPDIQFPTIGIVTTYEGVGPVDVENLISQPIEETVVAIENVEQIESRSSQNTSTVILEFDYDTDMDEAENDVRNRLELVRDVLPEDASSPLVFAFDPSFIPILFLSVSSPTLGPAELRRISTEQIEPLFERVPGVANAQTQGGLERQINVMLDPVKLAAYKLSPQQVLQSVRSGSGLMPAGNIETDQLNYSLRVLSEYRNVGQVKKTIAGIRAGQTIRVEDLAEVKDGFKEQTADVRANFRQGILIDLTKQTDANTVLTSERAKAAIPEIVERLPEGTEFNIIWDQADFIRNSINNLRNTAFIAFILAFIVIYLFLRNWRGSVIMAVGIPVSILATFSVLMLADLTLNIVTMAGLALAIGLLLDNSIVVLENIYRHREKGKDQSESASVGASEVGRAIIASTLTTISVFLPVLFVPDITGELFSDMVLTITFSLFVSLVVALSLVPMLSSTILKIESKEKQTGFIQRMKDVFERGFAGLHRTYGRSLRWSLDHKAPVLIAVFLLFLGSLGLLPFLGGAFLPQSDRNIINLDVEVPPGTPLHEMRLTVTKLEDVIRDVVPEIEGVSFTFGAQSGFGALQSSPTTIQMLLRLPAMEQRKHSQFYYEDQLRQRLDRMPGITYQIQETGRFSGERDIEVKLFGFDLDEGTALARTIKEKMEQVEGLVDIALNIEEKSPELEIRLDKDKLNYYGLSQLQVARNISVAIQGQVGGQLREAGEEYDIRIQLAEEYRNNRESIQRILQPVPGGGMIPLRTLGTVIEQRTTPTIFRENQNRFISVGCGLSGTDLSTAIDRVNAIIAETPIPGEFQVVIGGTAEDQQTSFRYLTWAFLAAILLVYMIMASQFESLIHPFTIMFTVPLSVIGVFISLFLTGTDISVMSLVGLVMLSGIAVNNGIVMVDLINQMRAEGLELREAVEEGSMARMRPILMTGMTTILGMTPLALKLGAGSETWVPLARAVIGGLITANLLTLIVIPIFYLLFERLAEKVKGNKK